MKMQSGAKWFGARLVGLGLLQVALTCSTSSAKDSSPLDIPLTIQEVAGVTRQSESCSTGVPLPAGVLREPTGVAVLDPSGKAVPAQFRVLERWREKAVGKDDLSIKWLLVTFLADVPAGGEVVYRLRPGQNPAPANPVEPVATAGGYTMGGLTFKRDLSAPFRLVMTDPEGRAVDATELPVKWSIWEEGPLRACLKAESITVPGRFGFTAWIYTYAGQQRWDMTLTLNNTPREAQGPLYFKDFSVVWDPPGMSAAKDGFLGGEPGQAAPVTAPACLYQDSDGTDRWDEIDGRNCYVIPWSKLKDLGKPAFRGYKVRRHDQESAKGGRALGWAALNGSDGGALVCLRHFPQNYPKAAEIEAGRIIMRLWPKCWKAHGGLHWIDDCQRKDHDLSFRLHHEPVSAEVGEVAAKAFNAPLIAHCGIEWYRRAGVVPHNATLDRRAGPDPKPLDRMGDRNWVTFGGDITDRIRRRYHGYDKSPFITRANPFDAHVLAAYARHSATVTPLWVDDYRYPRDSEMLTHRQYCGLGRDAGAYRRDTAHHGYMSWNHSHFCCQELFDAWRLRADPVAWDAIQGVAAYCMSYVDFRESGGSLVAGTRADGLPLYNLCEAYRVTGDKQMRDVLHRFADVCWNQVDKARGHYGVMESWEGGKERCEKPFMMCQVIQGLRAYYDLTEDERTLDQIQGMLDFILEEATLGDRGWTYVVKLDPGKQKPYRETVLKEIKSKGNSSYTHLSPHFAWLHRFTGEARFRTVIDQIDPKPYPHLSRAYTEYYPEREDAVPPQPIGDLEAKPLGDGKVSLTWTVPAGKPVGYQVKWAGHPIQERINWQERPGTRRNWWAAVNVPDEPHPSAAGSRQHMIVEGVKPGRCSFAIRSYDEVRNRSGLSNMADVTVR